MDYMIFNVHTYVNECDCTRGCMDTVRKSALKVDLEKNPLPHRGIEPASKTCRSDALPTELRVSQTIIPANVDKLVGSRFANADRIYSWAIVSPGLPKPVTDLFHRRD